MNRRPRFVRGFSYPGQKGRGVRGEGASPIGFRPRIARRNRYSCPCPPPPPAIFAPSPLTPLPSSLLPMKFVDEATIRVHAGNGGNGCARFRRAKFIPFA